MRSLLLLLLALALVVTTSSVDAVAQPRRQRAEDLARARALDKEGVKAFGEGRYNDAIRYFEEAHRLGGPPFELWNIAKCHLRLDQPEQAAAMLERYLETPNLPADDRREASEQLDELRARPSTLTVSSSPTGATVTLDGNPVEEGKTPVSVTIPPGRHRVTVALDGHVPFAREFEARYGRAIIVDAPLASDNRPPPPENPYTSDDERRVALRGLIGVVLPRHGEVGGEASLGGIVTGTYRISDGAGSAPAIALGGLLSLTGDSWSNTVDAPSTLPSCRQPLPTSFDATALSVYAIATAGLALLPRLRVVGTGGVGVAGYLVPDTGGDLFVPSCTSSPGLRPALVLAAQIDYALVGPFRLTAMPLSLQLHPAFAGVRTSPIDAGGVWLRFGMTVGIGVDL